MKSKGLSMDLCGKLLVIRTAVDILQAMVTLCVLLLNRPIALHYSANILLEI